MNRNVILAGALIVVVGLAAGAWLAFEPAAPGPGTTGPSMTGPSTTGPSTTGLGTAGPGATSADPAETPEEGGGRGVAGADETTTAATGGEQGESPAAAERAADESAADEGAPASTTDRGEASAAAEKAPSFDIVRVERDGSAVIAGRAAPGAEVTLMDGAVPLAKARAGADGTFALVLDEPLPPGNRTLSLTAEGAEGAPLASTNEVIVVVPQGTAQADTRQGTPGGPAPAAAAPEAADAAAPADAAAGLQPAEPIVVIAPRGGEGASRVVQVPGGLSSGELQIAAVDYDLEGQVTISGKAPPGSRVLVYLNDAPIGEALTGEDGTWSVRPDGSVSPGLHRLRADLLDDQGKVVARVETPFSRAAPIELAGDETFVVVQPGNNLWVIARSHYGRGIRYTAIYEANAGQIRDPDLIYPGQIFLIPQVN